ncbi:MAG: glycine zipper 2TM domain-containing protein [Paraglaciecola sp.]|uniref:glycine zipper 2TM domain-containing protein n=1 Tax=Paraglaciecola sp. TaxID=1920173 RepID=UPI0027400C22|nr:glycine zipper 2TM domain-containing protein [Paraglaciecola sp.]MDP5032529.1 glycine zipper 2TM domain-containing protein [Paraglaciecola sp.]MDP5133783.1 glycine zipper 2TM domain-containing protein [Paraglaciecola sp.]
MKKKTVILISLLVLSTSTFAKQHKVKVLEVQPIYEYVVVNKPVEQCRTLHSRQLTVNHDGALFGSVIGGTIGNMTSERKNRTEATIIGAVIGGVIGSQIDNNRHSVRSPALTCTTHYVNTEKVRVIAGYDYWYRVNGKMYKGFSEQEPSRYISLRK